MSGAIKLAVNAMMVQNIGAFVLLDTVEVIQVAEFLIFVRGMEPSKVAAMLRNNPGGFLASKRRILENTTAYTDDLFARGGEIGEDARKKSNAMMENNLFAYANIDTEEAESVHEFLTVHRGIGQDRFETMIQDNPAGLSLAKRKKLEHLTKYMDQLFSEGKRATMEEALSGELIPTVEAKASTNAMMETSLSDFCGIDTEETDKLQELFVVERGMERARFVSMIRNSPSNIGSVMSHRARRIAEHIDAFFAHRRGGQLTPEIKAVTNAVMERNPTDFFLIDTDNFDEFMKFLIEDRDMGEVRAEALVQNSTTGIAAIKNRAYKQTAKKLDVLFSGDKSITNTVMEKSLRSFVEIDPSEIDSLEDYIHNVRGIRPGHVILMVQRSPEGLTTTRQRLQHVAEHVDAFLAQYLDGYTDVEIKAMTNSMMRASFSRFYSIDTDNMDQLVDCFLNERNMGKIQAALIIRNNPTGIVLTKRDTVKPRADRMDASLPESKAAAPPRRLKP